MSGSTAGSTESDGRVEATLRVYDDDDLRREILGLRVVQPAGGWRVDHRVGGYSDRAIALGMTVGAAIDTSRKGRQPIIPSALGAANAGLTRVSLATEADGVQRSLGWSPD
jgi:hypothetical protein